MHTCTLERERRRRDPRKGSHRKYELRDMLFASLMSVLCGYDSYMLRSVQVCKRASGQHPAVGTSTSFRGRRLALETGADR